MGDQGLDLDQTTPEAPLDVSMYSQFDGRSELHEQAILTYVFTGSRNAS